MDATANYQTLVNQLKAEIQSARLKASLSVNVQLLALYWKMGKAIAEQETQEGWGAKVVTQLAADLRREFPDMKGISPRNLRYMRDFALAYPTFMQPDQNLQDPLAKTGEPSILQAPLAKLASLK